MLFLFGLLGVGCLLGYGVGAHLPLPGPRGVPDRDLGLGGIFVILVTVGLGGALGLFGPAFLFAALDIGTGSYEDVLFIWPITIPFFALAKGLIAARLLKRG